MHDPWKTYKCGADFFAHEIKRCYLGSNRKMTSIEPDILFCASSVGRGTAPIVAELVSAIGVKHLTLPQGHPEVVVRQFKPWTRQNRHTQLENLKARSG